jgi:hypothetical protein
LVSLFPSASRKQPYSQPTEKETRKLKRVIPLYHLRFSLACLVLAAAEGLVEGNPSLPKDCLVGSRPKLTYAEKRIGIWALCDSRLSEWKESQGGPITADTEKASKIEDDNVR